MTSLYDVMFDDIPMFVVPGTENSEVIEYETSMQRTVRLMNEERVRQQMAEIGRLQMQIMCLALAGPWKQKRLPEKCGCSENSADWRSDGRA